MQNTNIEWTDHTLNFWWGCTKVSPACTHCYAESVAKVFGKRLFGTVPTWGAGQPRFQRLEAARKEAIAMNKRAQKVAQKWDHEAAELISRGSVPPTFKPRRPRVFVNSMSDWLDAEVPIEWLAYLLETIHLCPNLDFQLLTKRPENWETRIMSSLKHIEAIPDDWSSRAPETKTGEMINEWLGENPPPNVWIGTTVEDQTRADQRLPNLLQIPARIRFLSCEPLLEKIDLRIPQLRGAMDDPRFGGNFRDFREALHWVIAGGESGGQARPTHPDWFRSLRDQCAAAHVPFFFKQWGEWYPQSGWGSLPAEIIDKGRTKYRGHKFEDSSLMLHLGSDHTGRILDSRLHDAFPQV